ncbi:MAG: YceI family protein [Bryobacteraceae bacterium]
MSGNRLVGAEKAPAADYTVYKSYSTIGFSVYKWVVMKEEGVFREFSGSIHYDPANPERSRVEITAVAASLDTGNSGRDAVLRSDDFFDVAKFPTLHFVSGSVAVTNRQEVELGGKLTIRGVTKCVHVPARINGTSDVPGVGTLAGFETDFRVDRREYGVNVSDGAPANLQLATR